MEDCPTAVDRDPLEVLAEEFIQLLRSGQRPVVAEFAERLPGSAGRVAELLETLMVLEDYFRAADLGSDVDWAEVAALLAGRS